ncbi:MAG: MBL fold metallo-hydrolase [Bacteroidales bacterium]|nr:MBL fold metallo-hydrolase [Bacteroidales bacterium]
MKKLIHLILLVPILGFAQRDYSTMHVSHTELAPGIHRLFVGDIVTVVAFTGDDGLMVIDAAYEQTTSQLLDTLKRITSHTVKYLLNTHLHGDHTGGNVELGKGATIISHHSVKTWLTSDRKQGDRVPGPMPQQGIPNFTFEGTFNMEFNGQVLQMYHLPEGHTAGDVIIYFSGSNVLMVGDLLFADYFPYVDTGQGGNPLGYINNVKWIIKHFPQDAVVVGGHGPVYNMQQLQEWLSNLEETIEIIADAKQDGLNAAQMKENRILAKWESFGSFFITEDRWIDTVFPYVGNE